MYQRCNKTKCIVCISVWNKDVEKLKVDYFSRVSMVSTIRWPKLRLLLTQFYNHKMCNNVAFSTSHFSLVCFKEAVFSVIAKCPPNEPPRSRPCYQQCEAMSSVGLGRAPDTFQIEIILLQCPNESKLCYFSFKLNLNLNYLMKNRGVKALLHI